MLVEKYMSDIRKDIKSNLKEKNEEEIRKLIEKFIMDDDRLDDLDNDEIEKKFYAPTNKQIDEYEYVLES